MYLAVDVGGTKTLVAAFNDAGEIVSKSRFPTPRVYRDFLDELADNVAKLSTTTFKAAVLGIPGEIDRLKGVGQDFGNLKWHKVFVRSDVQKIVNCPVLVENDAKLGALGEAKELKKNFNKVLYITLGTGIGIGLVVNGQIETSIGDGGGKTLLLEHKGSMRAWESFASGKAILKQFDKRASEIDDRGSWKIIAKNIAVGLIDLIALTQPEVVILGGGVGVHFSKFADLLERDLERYERPMLDIPPIKKATRPEEAVIYGCYELAKDIHEKTS